MNSCGCYISLVEVIILTNVSYSIHNIVQILTLLVDWQHRRCPLMHGSRAMRINGKNNGDPIMDCRQHTLAMKRTESYICDTLNTESAWTPPPTTLGGWPIECYRILLHNLLRCNM